MSLKKRWGWLPVLLGGVWLAVWGGGLARTGLSLREHLVQVQALADTPGSASPAAACDLVRDLREDVAALGRQAGGLVRVAPVLGWLPKVGGDVRAAPHLLAVADGVSEAGALACDALEPALAAFEGRGGGLPGFSVEAVAHLLAGERGALEQALAAAERAQEAWAQVEVESLSPPLAGKVRLLERGLPLMCAGLEVAAAAPNLLGMGEPRTYLIVAQNEDELRPTGGFISGVGRLTLDGGRIAELSFLDANVVDDYAHKPYPEPPEPLLKYMGSELWLFRDANWSPDFPTSARHMMDSYEYGQAVPVNGVVALDQRAVELVLGGLGQVQVPGSAEAVTAANVRDLMRAAWNPGEAGVSAAWLSSRKEFIGDLAAVIRERVERDPRSVDWVQVAKGLYQALAGRHLLVFVDEADVARTLARMGWDGAVRESAGDYLMVVDANLGFGKVNPLVDESVRYRVTLHADGTATAELSLAYKHRGSREGVHCQHPLPYASELTYEAMMHRCYYDYVRMYVPAGSVLRAATAHPTPGRYLLRGEPDDGRAVTQDGEAGKTVFAQFFVVEYGQALTTHLAYDLPQVTRLSEGRWHYMLLMQKQPGTGRRPVSLEIVMPPGARLLTVRPPARSMDGGTITLELDLDADAVVEAVYE